jgi:hypothetical protein
MIHQSHLKIQVQFYDNNFFIIYNIWKQTMKNG